LFFGRIFGNLFQVFGIFKSHHCLEKLFSLVLEKLNDYLTELINTFSWKRRRFEKFFGAFWIVEEVVGSIFKGVWSTLEVFFIKKTLILYARQEKSINFRKLISFVFSEMKKKKTFKKRKKKNFLVQIYLIFVSQLFKKKTKKQNSIFF